MLANKDANEAARLIKSITNASLRRSKEYVDKMRSEP